MDIANIKHNYSIVIFTLFSVKHYPSHYIFDLSVKCGYPLSSLDDVIGSVSGYSDPALVGSNATVWCPNQLTGSSTTVITCMSNGNWNPEPGMILQACSGI